MKIKFDNLSLGFSNELGNRRVVLQNFSLDFGSEKETGIATFLLPVNSGKSALAKLLAGIISPEAGALKFNNSKPDFSKTAYINCQKAFPGLSLKDLFEITAGKSREKRNSANSLQEVAKKVGLDGYEEHIPSANSLGYQIRMMLALGFFNQADLFVIDDPFIGLDKNNFSAIMDLIREIGKEKQIILINSSISHSVSISDAIYLMSEPPVSLIENFVLKDKIEERGSATDKIYKLLTGTKTDLFTQYLL